MGSIYLDVKRLHTYIEKFLNLDQEMFFFILYILYIDFYKF